MKWLSPSHGFACPKSQRCVTLVPGASALSSAPRHVSFNTLCPPATVGQVPAGKQARGVDSAP